MATRPEAVTLSTGEWAAFLERVGQPLAVRRRDAFWYEGELIDRSFVFVFRAGQLAGASESFATTTGAPPRPFEDPAAAWSLVAAGQGDLARAVGSGAIIAPRLTFQLQWWLMPDVVAYEVNYLANDADELFAGKPTVGAGPGRWDQIVRSIREDVVRFDGMEGQFQRARYLQTYIAFRFVDGVLEEAREMGFGRLPDQVFPNASAVWHEVGSGRLSPLRDVPAGRFGPDVVVNFRVLKHGQVGHLGIFLRPLARLGAA